MTIKEIEEKCGMSRTNIRFYESEGLIAPERRENGYREYSEEDVQILLKVKLLRAMEIPLEGVRALCAGEFSLHQALERLEQELERRQLRQNWAREAAGQMLRSGVDFETLDPREYLPLLESGEAPWQGDSVPRVNLPWRRYWARGLDYVLYMILAQTILRTFPNWSQLDGILIWAAALLIEPLLLSLFATTPGKAVFGIRVTDPEGARLSYGDALVRTWTVLWEGEALRIPVVTHYFQYKSLNAAENDETLPWEWDSELTFADNKNWRYVLYFALFAVVGGCYFWMTMGGG